MWYILDVAHPQLPAVRDPDQLPARVVAKLRAQEMVMDLMLRGMAPNEIARKLAKGDPKKAQAWRKRIRNWTYSDARFTTELAQKYKAQTMMEAVSAAPAVGRRARRGRVDAWKALNEVSGLHNPRMTHEHSGEVSIKLIMPRPPEVSNNDQVVDAEVVE